MLQVTMCSIEGCDRPNFARTWCRIHYYRWTRQGDPNVVKFVRGDLALRLSSHIERTSECWNWTGTRDEKGYGHIRIGRKMRPAHRVAYEIANGPVPRGMEVDHLCRNRRCVRPEHLEAVTHHENTLRGQNFIAQHARKTECLRGHPFDSANTYITPSTGSRQCKACVRLRLGARAA